MQIFRIFKGYANSICFYWPRIIFFGHGKMGGVNHCRVIGSNFPLQVEAEKRRQASLYSGWPCLKKAAGRYSWLCLFSHFFASWVKKKLGGISGVSQTVMGVTIFPFLAKDMLTWGVFWFRTNLPINRKGVKGGEIVWEHRMKMVNKKSSQNVGRI